MEIIDYKEKYESIQKFNREIKNSFKNINKLVKDSNKTLDDVLEAITNEVRVIDKSTVHSRLYEVCEISNEIKDKIIFSGLKLRSEEKVLKRLYDSRNNPRDTDTGIYLAIEEDSVTGDAFENKMPIVSLNKEFFNFNEFIEGVHYSTEYDTGRFYPYIQNRAAFPIINKFSKEVNYVLIIDKEKGLPLREMDIASIQSFVNLAEEEIYNKKERIKQINTREILHNIKGPLAVIGMQQKRELNFYKKSSETKNNAIEMLEKLQDDPRLLLNKNFVCSLKDLITNIYPENRYKELESSFEVYKRLEKPMKEIGLGEYIYNFKSVDINDLIKSKVTEISTLEYDKNLNIELYLDSNSPKVKIDPDSFLSHALENMFRNSKEAIKDNECNIYLATKQENDKLLFTYKDNNGGMPKDIFEKIINQDYCTTKTNGTGLGIRSIKKTLENQNCIVTMNNYQGSGLEYVIKIPIDKD
ncbi:MAG: ATP-binding protein [Candidatus Woesearchaeota archaeon]